MNYTQIKIHVETFVVTIVIKLKALLETLLKIILVRTFKHLFLFMKVHFVGTGGGLAALCARLLRHHGARQTPLSMGFSSQECWCGLLCPSPVHLPNPGTEPGSPALQVDSLLTEPPEKASLILK